MADDKTNRSVHDIENTPDICHQVAEEEHQRIILGEKKTTPTETTAFKACIPGQRDNKIVYPNEAPVIIPDGSAIPVKGRGECNLEGGAKLKGVPYIPEFNCNLLSVSRLANDLQCAVTFFPDFCVMQKLHTRRLISAGKCRKGSYRMGLVNGVRRAMMSTRNIWHKRLGHASEDKLVPIDFLKGITLNKLCDSCSKANHTRLRFSRSFIKTNACFDLVHCDICGKYRTPSLSRANYSKA